MRHDEVAMYTGQDQVGSSNLSSLVFFLVHQLTGSLDTAEHFQLTGLAKKVGDIMPIITCCGGTFQNRGHAEDGDVMSRG